MRIFISNVDSYISGQLAYELKHAVDSTDPSGRTLATADFESPLTPHAAHSEKQRCLLRIAGIETGDGESADAGNADGAGGGGDGTNPSTRTSSRWATTRSPWGASVPNRARSTRAGTT